MIAGVRAARAQDVYPNRVIKLVVPWPPGGVTDVTGRFCAQKLSTELGQTMIVENRQGAAGTIGHAAVAQSAPDGYTLLLGTNSTYAIAPHLFGSCPTTATRRSRRSRWSRAARRCCARIRRSRRRISRSFLDYVRARQPDGVIFESRAMAVRAIWRRSC